MVGDTDAELSGLGEWGDVDCGGSYRASPRACGGGVPWQREGLRALGEGTECSERGKSVVDRKRLQLGFQREAPVLVLATVSLVCESVLLTVRKTSTSGGKDVTNMTDAFVEDTNTVKRSKWKSWTFTSAITLLAFCLLSGTGESATLQDLKDEITSLIAAVNRDISQDIEVINAITVAIAPPQSLTVGTVEGSRGVTVNVPVYLKASTAPVAGVQFDIPNSTGLIVTSVLPGLAAQAVGKSVSGNQVTGAFRVIVFGLNQTAIPSGPVVVMRVNIGLSSVIGKKPVSITNLSASSPTGSTVVLTGKAGTLTVR